VVYSYDTACTSNYTRVFINKVRYFNRASTRGRQRFFLSFFSFFLQVRRDVDAILLDSAYNAPRYHNSRRTVSGNAPSRKADRVFTRADREASSNPPSSNPRHTRAYRCEGLSSHRGALLAQKLIDASVDAPMYYSSPLATPPVAHRWRAMSLPAVKVAQR